MPFDTAGFYIKRSITDLTESVIRELRTQFGRKFDAGAGSPARKFVDAVASLPWSEHEADMEDLVRNVYFFSARGEALRAISFMYPPLPATRASGDVQVSLKSVPATPAPFFTTGAVVLTDTAGRKYDLIADVGLPSATFDSDQTGVASESIGASTTRIAQRFVLTGAAKFVQGFGCKVTHGGTPPVFTVRVETDASGSASGTLAHADLSKTGFAPTNNVFTRGVWTQGALLGAGTYWLLFTRTAGEGTFDGGTGGTANQVKVFTGSWAVSTPVENLNVEVTTGLVMRMRAQEFGAAGNIAIGDISDEDSFSTAAVETRWNDNVDTFDNLVAFSGGRDEETTVQYRNRVRTRLAAHPECSLDGALTAVERTGVDSVSGKENTTDTGGTEDSMFNPPATGTASQAIDGTRTRIAQKFTTTKRRFVQHFDAKLFADTALIASVRLETDSSGSPSAMLVQPEFVLAAFDFNGTTLTPGSFDNGNFLDAGTYWLVFTRTSGSGTFDGDNGGSAGDVKDFDGSWANDANINRLNVSVTGGIPPHGVRIFPDGGDVDKIAQALWDTKPTGIDYDGVDSGTAKSRGVTDVTVRFERPTIVSIFVDIIITKTSKFAGNADTIRDLIVEYIGGTTVAGKLHAGLPVDGDVLVDQVRKVVLEVTGVNSITSLKVDSVNPPVSTTDKAIAFGEKSKVLDAGANIIVTLNDA